MVGWVYAGGGDSEVGFIKRLIKYFDSLCEIEQQTPLRNTKRPRPKSTEAPVGGTFGHGDTGISLQKRIEEHISLYWDGSAGAILVCDDSDCANPQERKQQLEQAVERALQTKNVSPENTPVIIVGLAVPEIEAWLLADWENTFQHEFPEHHHRLGQELEKRKIQRDKPEEYCNLPEIERGKFSDVIKDQVNECCFGNFKKGTDVPRLLQRIDLDKVSEKCPNFRKFWIPLKQICQT